MAAAIAGMTWNAHIRQSWRFNPVRHSLENDPLPYFEEGRRSAAKLLTKDEARRMATTFAKLPELLRRNDWVSVAKLESSALYHPRRRV